MPSLSESPLGGVGKVIQKKGVVRGSVDSVDSVAIERRYELTDGIGSEIKVIIQTTFPGNTGEPFF